MAEGRAAIARARLLGERFLYRVPGSAAPETTGAVEDFDAAAWDALRSEVAACTRCELHRTRTQAVFGSGTPRTSFMVIGEAPGFHEDQQGEAFVGRGGQLLTKILEAIGFGRDQVFITNILKSRPPGNADPLPHQVAACEPYLARQIELIGPAVILTLGRHAARTLLGFEGPMASFRGRVFEYRGVPVVATYHPAALLRNPGLKRPTWDDVQLARRVYDERMAGRDGGSGGEKK
ncbi:MAG TPA: uracil-DNA glycosylase [Gemmatimonadota bacterium]|nr:uracil-DNA glycosylase [Gemmatimonadota bacterium]